MEKKQGNVAAEEMGDEHAGHVHVHTHAEHGHAHGSVTTSGGTHSPELIRHRIIAQVMAEIKFINCLLALHNYSSQELLITLMGVFFRCWNWGLCFIR